MIHGYLSQAFAISDPYQVLGIPEDGTFDYRTAALQFRANVTPKDSFVIQFAQERLGESPVMAVRNEIDLDWIFYERDLGAETRLRVGRIKVPYGIYNEIRVVGPLLPFFRPPDAFYGEGSYVVSSISGVMVSKSLFAAHPFSVDADLYGGQWSFLQSDAVTRAQAKKGIGGQLWLNTPVRGLRFGLAGHHSTWSNSIQTPPGSKVPHNRWAASVDGNFERFRVNAEFEEDTFPDTAAQASYVLVRLARHRQAEPQPPGLAAAPEAGPGRVRRAAQPRLRRRPGLRVPARPRDQGGKPLGQGAQLRGARGGDLRAARSRPTT